MNLSQFNKAFKETTRSMFYVTGTLAVGQRAYSGDDIGFAVSLAVMTIAALGMEVLRADARNQE